MTEAPPARLSAARYRVERKLGEGRTAVVYLAEDLKHHRKVALEVLRPELTATPGSDPFPSEIRTAAVGKGDWMPGLRPSTLPEHREALVREVRVERERGVRARPAHRGKRDRVDKAHGRRPAADEVVQALLVQRGADPDQLEITALHHSDIARRTEGMTNRSSRRDRGDSMPSWAGQRGGI